VSYSRGAVRRRAAPARADSLGRGQAGFPAVRRAFGVDTSVGMFAGSEHDTRTGDGSGVGHFVPHMRDLFRSTICSSSSWTLSFSMLSKQRTPSRRARAQGCVDAHDSRATPTAFVSRPWGEQSGKKGQEVADGAQPQRRVQAENTTENPAGETIQRGSGARVHSALIDCRTLAAEHAEARPGTCTEEHTPEAFARLAHRSAHCCRWGRVGSALTTPRPSPPSSRWSTSTGTASAPELDLDRGRVPAGDAFWQ
jgi:hypothetical protein